MRQVTDLFGRRIHGGRRAGCNSCGNSSAPAAGCPAADCPGASLRVVRLQLVEFLPAAASSGMLPACRDALLRSVRRRRVDGSQHDGRMQGSMMMPGGAIAPIAA